MRRVWSGEASFGFGVVYDGRAGRSTGGRGGCARATNIARAGDRPGGGHTTRDRALLVALLGIVHAGHLDISRHFTACHQDFCIGALSLGQLLVSDAHLSLIDPPFLWASISGTT